MELMLVVLIIALLAALAVPALRLRSRDLQRRGRVFELVNLLRRTRTAAAGSGLCHAVRMEPAGEAYVARVFRLAPQGQDEPVRDSRWARAVPIPPVKAVLSAAAQAPTDTQRELSVLFTPNGVDRSTVIELASGDERTIRIEVLAPSGLVRLLPSDPGTMAAGERLAVIRNYWQAHCRQVGP